MPHAARVPLDPDPAAEQRFVDLDFAPALAPGTGDYGLVGPTMEITAGCTVASMPIVMFTA